MLNITEAWVGETFWQKASFTTKCSALASKQKERRYYQENLKLHVCTVITRNFY